MMKAGEFINEALINKYRKDFGDCSFNGKSYVLMQQAYITSDNPDNEWYAATAFSPEDEVDENASIPAYAIRWEILPETYEYWNNGGEDEGDACDWENPVEVSEFSYFYVEENKIF